MGLRVCRKTSFPCRGRPSKTLSPHALGAVVTLCVFSPHPQGFILPRRRLAPSPLGVPQRERAKHNAKQIRISDFGIRRKRDFGFCGKLQTVIERKRNKTQSVFRQGHSSLFTLTSYLKMSIVCFCR